MAEKPCRLRVDVSGTGRPCPLLGVFVRVLWSPRGEAVLALDNSEVVAARMRAAGRQERLAAADFTQQNVGSEVQMGSAQ